MLPSCKCMFLYCDLAYTAPRDLDIMRQAVRNSRVCSFMRWIPNIVYSLYRVLSITVIV